MYTETEKSNVNKKKKKQTHNPKKTKSQGNKNPTTTLWEDDASLASKLAPGTYKFRSTLAVAQLCKMAPNEGH